MPICSHPVLDGRSTDHITSYPTRLCYYVYIWIFFSVSNMISKLPRSTTRMACASLKPVPSWMLNALMASLVGHWGRRHGGDGVVCKQLAPWRIGLERVIVILVGTGNKGIRKSPVLATVEYTAIFGGVPPSREMGEA